MRMRKRRSSAENGDACDAAKNVALDSVLVSSEKVVVAKVSHVYCLIAGLALGCLFSGPLGKDLMDTLRGYRWDYQQKCIMESPNANGYGVDFCRIPADCGICAGVKKIQEFHVNDLTVEMFQEKFAYSSVPIVVRNASLHWKAMKVLDYYWLKEEYLKEPEIMENNSDDCWFNRYQTKEFRNLASVFRLPDRRVTQKDSKPWYVGWAVCHPTVAQELFNLFDRPDFIDPDSTPPSRPWIFIGTPGPGAHSHIDNVGLSTWQAQISGTKKWSLAPPPECYWQCGPSMEVIVHPGDIIVIDTNYWFHSTQILGSDLSLVITVEYD